MGALVRAGLKVIGGGALTGGATYGLEKLFGKKK
ncbi:GatB family leaderless bacteriocin [Priestia aryabhattai]|nr:GatB family leaderless bacteriocin [Priestia aryabhattai]MED4261499.1 GatB family leaderless bacteriocin [Priestia aryabhattai]